MTASTPTPADSGAAASRDAARTARRLTDGTLPRTSPHPGGEPVPPATATATPPHQTPTPPAPAATTATAAPPSPTVAAPPSPTVADTPTAAPAAPAAPADRADRIAPHPAPGETAGPSAPAASAPAPVDAPSGVPSGAPSGTPAPSAPEAATPTGAHPLGSVAGTTTGPSAPAAPRQEPPTSAPAGAPAPTAPSAASPAAEQPAAERPATARPVDPAVAVKPTVAATPAVALTPTAARTATPEADRPSTGTPAETADSASPAPVAASAPVTGSAPVAASAAVDTPPAAVPVPPVTAKATAKVSVVKERVDVPDFARITGARVAALAVPVAGVVRVARRKNVIGAETTGSIPVHLLFRDEPEGGAPALGATVDDGGPDTLAMAAPTAPAKNGKAAIPAPAKTQTQTESQKKQAQPQARTKGQAKPWSSTPAPTPALPPAPTREQSRSASRPAPTADPDLVERPGPVLPGWVGVAGGALALAGCAALVWWTGAVPAEAARMLRLPARPYHGIHLGQWALLALGVVATLFALGGLGRGRVGYAWVLTLFGDYRGTVRRTGLVWVSPLLLRRRVDVRLRHWRSEPLPAVDAKGTALDVVVLVVWRVRDTVRAALGVDGHEEYLREQVEAAMARVLSQLPADAFHEDAPTLRDAEAVGEALTRMLSAECAPVGVDVFSAQPTRIEYAPEVAAAMQRRRIAAIDAKHRDSVLTSVVDAVDDVVHRLTSRGLVELDDYERKALVKDLTVAFYTGRTAPAEGA
ncbi:SPFH domain-containing protein [Streptomyces sp. NPDC056169]|uniref:SPFH domain-containing protein n=1 Tax=Streptomyces sp. NPDC056169 TaxID=3345734 RepID=UPI0035DB7A68